MQHGQQQSGVQLGMLHSFYTELLAGAGRLLLTEWFLDQECIQWQGGGLEGRGG